MKKQICLLILASLTVLVACKKTEMLSDQEGAGIQGKQGQKKNAKLLSSVFNVVETQSANLDRDRLQNNWMLTDFTATGLYLAPNDTLKLNVQLTAGTRLPKLLIGTYSRYGGWNSQPASVQLTAGSNTITNAQGGLLWIRYTNSTLGSTATITFNSGFVNAPYYKIGVTTSADWQNQLATSAAPDVVMEGTNCYVVVEKAKAIQYQNEDQTAVLNKIKQITDLEDDLSGLDGSNALHTRSIYKYLLTQHEDANYYFFAYDYRTAYIGTSIKAILEYNSLNGNGWGVWHELGHQHQQKWTWSAITEVSVNIFSLYVQRTLTGHNRLVDSGNWPSAFTYLGKPADTKDYNGSTTYANPLTDVFVRLCMFEQLRLAFGDNFYREIARKTREEAPSFANTDAKMSYFMLSACKRSGKDLTAFFKKWGFNLSTTAATTQIYNDIAALGYPAPTVDPSTLQN